MSLISALNIGKSALAAHQAAIQVTSNNVANAGNPDYTRETPVLSPTADTRIGANLLSGTGVTLANVQRQIDDALEGRIRGSFSDTASADTRQTWLGRMEGVFNELGDNDLSTQFSAFFSSWSNLANKPEDIGLRQLVIQSGESLATGIRQVRGEISDLTGDINNRLGTLASSADSLAQQVADLNQQIANAESAGGTAGALRDQRDGVLKQLSQLMDVKVQQSSTGMVNVLAGSTPIVLGNVNRGIKLEMDTSSGTAIGVLRLKENNAELKVSSGEIGGLVSLQTDFKNVANQVDDLAGGLIFELNKIHSSGQGIEGTSQVTAQNFVNDATIPLNAPLSGLKFAPTSGSFVVHLKQAGTGLTTSTLVQVDLDGQGADTTLTSLAASLNSINGLSATVVAGKLKIQTSASDQQVSFSQDSSGTLAALGINSFYTGSNASDIAVNAQLKTSPGLLAAAKNGELNDNQTAQAIAALESQSMSFLQGRTLKDSYESMINGVAVSASSAKTSAQAASAVKDTLVGQREALSGVSLDEEAINLIREQRAFQGAARIISAVDELMKTILQMV